MFVDKRGVEHVNRFQDAFQAYLAKVSMVCTGKEHSSGISQFSIGNTSSIRVHFPASYVRLPECTGCLIGILTMVYEIIPTSLAHKIHGTGISTYSYHKSQLFM